ncbi:phage prohead protease, HK97 family [Pseudovibrio ascidiaceicola]|uniref:Phage prohead protease, HK97 family n=1 Tax=Pseudovibrio ascidiaceicola TaxID=285279 RepID=A0A1I3Z0Z5_9HYPH|nr:prohead protease/major capsid protein fusion protein [Pseudovibrio ascidiaceicola]SFK37728.1 phage prohead protease, HK97 family [Pseudovibrio ascidiaceicola]
MNAPAFLTRDLTFKSSSLDEKQRTVEATATAFGSVDRGAFIERLDPTATTAEAFIGLPVLDSHRQDSLSAVLGTVTAARADNGCILVTIKFTSDSRANPVIADIREGMITGVSIGYQVEKWADSRDPDTGRSIRTITQFKPREVSFVSVPADPDARIRAMPTENQPNSPEPPKTPTPDLAQRNQQIRSIAGTLNLTTEWTDSQIDSTSTLDEIRAAAITEAEKRTTPPIRTQSVQILADHTDPHTRAERMSDAMMTRIDPTHKPEDSARDFIGMSIPEMARDCLRNANVSTTALSQATIVSRALHSTSDFPLIMGNTVGRTLRQSYDSVPSALKKLARQTTVKDFRAKHRIILSEAPDLEKLNEHGEYKHGTMSESAESFKIDTFGRMIGITRQALINDDLGALNDLPRRLGIAAADFEAEFFIKLLEMNGGKGPKMGDGNPVFHEGHRNLAQTKGKPSIETLSVLRQALRHQVSLSGKRLNLSPRHLIIPAELETLAQKLLAEITPNRIDDVNPFSDLGMVVEGRFNNPDRWYLATSHSQMDGLEYAYLEGEPGPQTETKAGFEIDGIKIKVRLDFGACFGDWRGWQMNEGK